MAAVFDAPVAAIGCKHTFWIGLFWCTACDAIGNFTGIFAAFFIDSLSLDEERLPDVRKIEIAVEFSCDPYFSSFDPAVIRGIALNKIGIFPVLKIECNVFKKPGLVLLDGEVVMSTTFLNQIVSEVVLG